MSVSVSVFGYANADSKEYQKHLKAVAFCIENELSFPKETSEFFKGKVDECDLEDYKREYILEEIEKGFRVDLPMKGSAEYGDGIVINVSDIPKECDKIIVKYV